MKVVYQWISSILCFLIFITMVIALLPAKKYEKYIRFFTGMMLILLVISPLTKGLRLEDRIAYYFETITFQKESQDLEREILGIETQRLLRVIEEYEGAVERDIKGMAEDQGFCVESVKATIESDRDEEKYGTVTYIAMVVSKDEIQDRNEEQTGIVVGSVAIEPIQIHKDEDQDAMEDEPVVSAEEVLQLCRKVERYYGLESHEVEIKLKVR